MTQFLSADDESPIVYIIDDDIFPKKYLTKSTLCPRRTSCFDNKHLSYLTYTVKFIAFHRTLNILQLLELLSQKYVHWFQIQEKLTRTRINCWPVRTKCSN